MTDHKTPKPAPGFYTGKIAAYGIKKTGGGLAAPTIKFVVDGQAVFWQGSFKTDKSREIALKALMVCGLTDPHALPRLAEGESSGLLDMTKDVNVTIIHEAAEQGENAGKLYARVAWVNEAGGGKFKDALDTQSATALMAPLALEADFIRIAQENGYTVAPQGSGKAGEEDTIPF